METEERRGGSAKSSKKGGKCRKVRTAEEEEARRREEVKERLRGKLELERRASKVVERLLEDSVAEDFLIDCAKFITPANYKDTVEERFIAKLCAYPVCSNKLGKIPTQRYKISTKTNRVYDITERKCFCSNFCYKASKEYELQISKTPLWLRQHEFPPEIRLLKKGDGGSSGEEVKLSERRLKEVDVENPHAAPPEDLPGSQRGTGGSDHSQSSDGEQEQDFVSSIVSQQRRPRVQWADLPKRTDEDRHLAGQRQIQNPEKKGKLRGEQDGMELPVEKLPELNDDASPEDQCVKEATVKLNECSMSESVVPKSNLPVNTQTEVMASHTSSFMGTEPSAGSDHAPPSTPTGTQSNPESLSITQVGLSKKGAIGLQDLLKKQTAAVNPDLVRQNLQECLKRTLKEWSTEETLSFLYGAGYSPGSAFADFKETKEEELDEDDLEDDDGMTESGAEEQKRPSAAAPDYDTLRKETEQLQLRVREFYKGTWILPEEEELNPNKLKDFGTMSKDPALPLVDCHAQNLIQKRIVVEKLSSCLVKIVGPLGLSMSDISTDLNNLVRTFRFTNTNIIHRAPEWTFIAVVLLHLLSDVSSVVKEALQMSASVQYLNTLMEELGLQEQDLLSVVQLFKSSTNLQ